jgi:hypothetical protein
MDRVDAVAGVALHSLLSSSPVTVNADPYLSSAVADSYSLGTAAVKVRSGHVTERRRRKCAKYPYRGLEQFKAVK